MKKIILTILFIIGFDCLSFGQSDDGLKIFGYFQTNFQENTGFNLTLPNKLYGIIPGQSSTVMSSGSLTNTFALSQLNLFFQKNFSGTLEKFSTFVNFEVTNNYSSTDNWGSFKLEEAWVKYNYSDAFNIKAGQLNPEFNNLNTIKNKTPLLPYLFRPIVYEATISDIIVLENFVPAKAFLEISGKIPFSEDINFNYAIYGGNSESKYIKSTNGGITPRGLDSSTFKLIGGRFGIRSGNLKAGISLTSDKQSEAYIFAPAGLDGNLSRIRIGGDFSYSLGGFNLEAEVISVKVKMSDDQLNWLKSGYANYLAKDIPATLMQLGQIQYLLATEKDPVRLAGLIARVNQLSDNLKGQASNFATQTTTLGSGMDKLFYYFNFGYNFTDQIFAYLNYSYCSDKALTYFEDGASFYGGGISYRPNDILLIKGQWVRQIFAENVGYKQNSYFVGASIMF